MVQVQQSEEALSQMVCQRGAQAGALLRQEEAGPGSGKEDGAGFLPGGSGERGAVQGSDLVRSNNYLHKAVVLSDR
jgi:hypothetical protein